MYCYECFEKFKENDIKIFTCEKCKRKIHNNCLLYTSEQIEDLNIKECDTCRINLLDNNLIKRKCSICDSDGSKLCLHKWLNVNKLNYVHKKCARWFLKIDYELENKIIMFKSKKSLPDTVLLYDGKCHFCKKNQGNFFIKCKADGCEIYTHEQCICKHPLNYQSNGKYHLDFYCDEHKHYIKSKKIETMKVENEILYNNNNKENNLNFKKVSSQRNIIQNKNNSIEKNRFNGNHKNDKNEIIKKIDKIIGKEKKYSIIITVHKCLLCNDEILFDNEEKKNNFYCKKCLTYYHISCLKEYNNLSKNKKENECPICLTKEKSKKIENKKCCICNISKDCSLIIEDKLLHYICALAFSNFINFEFQKFKITFQKIKMNICCICLKIGLCYQCNKCNIFYHPFCAVKNQFTVKINNGNFINICNKKHKMFWTNKTKIKDFVIPSPRNKSKNEGSIKSTSTNSNKKFKNNQKKIKKKIVFKNRISVKYNNNNIHKSNEELITSLNYVYLKSLLQQKKVFEPNLLNKLLLSDNKKFNWDISNNYFYDFSKEEFETIIMKLKDNFIEESNHNNLIIKINEEDDCNLNIQTDNKYTLVKINKYTNQINSSFITLFNKSKLEKLEIDNHKMDIDDFPEQKIIRYEMGSGLNNENKYLNELKFISRKRGKLNIDLNLIQDINNKLNIQSKLRFLRGMKINKLSKKILELESQTNYSKGNSINFVEESLNSKYQMLQIIIEKTEKIINKIKIEYEKDYIENQIRKKNEIEKINILNKYKSIKIYKKLTDHLKNGIKIKTYYSIIEYINNKNQEKPYIENIKEYIQNQYKNDSECCICFDINQEEDIIFCDKCNTSYHSSCYGIKEIPFGNYFCDKCNYELKNNIKDIKCFLCFSSHGALKYYSDYNLFGHITCVLISQYCNFKNFLYLNSLNFIKELKDNYFDKCQVCNCNKGELFKCKCCHKYYHFFCIYFDGGEIVIEKQLNNSDNINLNLMIEKCKNNKEWNDNYRLEQIEIRKLIYQKFNMK